MNRIHKEYTVGIPSGGIWQELLSSDDKIYGGKGIINKSGIVAQQQQWVVRGFGYTMDSSHHIKDFSLTCDLPPLSVLFLKKQ
jgi:1,4-alpha-glucan branching enzyme